MKLEIFFDGALVCTKKVSNKDQAIEVLGTEDWAILDCPGFSVTLDGEEIY